MRRRFPSSIRLLITATLSLVLIVGTGLAFTSVSASIFPGVSAGIGSAISSWWSAAPAPLGSDFYQCANNDGNPKAPGDCNWIGSILQQQNSKYYEGSSVPQRIIFDNIPSTTGGTHVLNFKHQSMKGTIHAYDFLTSYEQATALAIVNGFPYVHTQTFTPNANGDVSVLTNTFTTAEACDEVITLESQCITNRGDYRRDVLVPDFTGSAVPILQQTKVKSDAYETLYGDRVIRLYSDEPITDASLVVDAVTQEVVGSDTLTYIGYNLSWTSTSDQILIEMAGHLANGVDGASTGVGWGDGFGSSSINGGPYHFKLNDLDGAALGSQDNQIKGADILLPKGSITIIKNASPDDAQDFHYNTTGTGLTGFDLDDDGDNANTLSNTKVFNDLGAGTYSVDEVEVAGWTLTNLMCSSSGSFSGTTDVPTGVATINLAAGENVTCTYTNSLHSAKITIVKNANPDNVQNFGFTGSGAGPAGFASFTLDDDALAGGDAACTGGNCLSQQTFTFTGADATGSKVITEGITGGGWILTSVSCSPEGTGDTLARTATVSLNPGDDVTCTFTNTNQGLIDGRIIVQKVTNPTSSTQSFEFDPSYNSSVNFFLQNGGSNDSGLIPAGTYSVSELVPSGWTLTSTVCTSSLGGTENNASIGLTGGETVTCVFTNTQDAKLTINKVTNPADSGAASFPFTVTGQTGFSLDTNAADNTFQNSKVFNYNGSGYGSITIDEGSTAGWTPTNLVCTAGQSTSIDIPTGVAVVTVDPGDDITCTYTNTKNASLTIVKVTDPADSGADSFPFTSGSSGVSSSFSLDTNAASGTPNQTTFNFNGTNYGSKSVTEGATTGWTLTNVNCTGAANTGSGATATVDIQPGVNAICTFTNKKNAKLTITKVTNPADSGADSFPFTVTGQTGFSLDTNAANNTFLNSKVFNYNGSGYGSVTIDEGSTTGWTPTNLVCTAGQSTSIDIPTGVAVVTVDPGDDITCTYTNSKLPKLRLQKVTVPASDVGKFDLKDGSTVKADEVGNGGDSGFFVTTTGSHTVSEVAGSTSTTTLADYASKVECNSSKGSADPGTSHTFSLDYGEEVTCVFTNSRLPRLKLVKATVPTSDPGKFDLRDGGVVKADEVGNGGTSGFYNTTTGSHTVSEVIGSTSTTALTDYVSKVECDSGKGSVDPGTSLAISLSYGDAVTCTFTNQRKPRLTIVKMIKGDPASFDFLIDRTGTSPVDPVDLTLDVVDPDGSASDGPHNIAVGDHNVQEVNIPDNWILTGAECTNAADVVISAGTLPNVTFAAGYGDDITCTFVNNQLGGTTRTQGFWSTHTYLANAVWNGWELPEGTSGQLDGWQPVIGSEDQFLCKADPVLYPPSGIAITAIPQPGQNQLMGGFWSNIANMSGSGKYKGGKRSDLDKVRMQFLQQYLAAVLNVHLFGTPLPSGYSLAGARTAYCNATADNMADLLTYRGVLAGYNEDGDLGVFTPGANATAQESRLQANIQFWDNTYR